MPGSNDVKEIYSTNRAFIALKNTGDIFVWGDNNYGDNSQITDISNVKYIYNTNTAFAALTR